MIILKSIVTKVSVPSETKTKQKEYLTTGAVPIIDQGQSLIGGYTNDSNKTIICDLPVIVFGDHTCCVKYIDFPFGAGADGIKVIKPKEGILPKYLYYGLQYLVFRLSNRGYGRHYQHIEKMSINVPPISQQERIISQIEESLSQLDSAVETLKKTKQQLEVYRQAVLKEAFDRIDGISQNMLIKDVCNEIKVGIVIKPAQYYTDSQNSIKTFRSANVREFLVNDSDWVYITKEGHEQNKRSEIHTNDVLIVRSGYPGTACVVPEKFNGCNAIDILIAVPKTSIIDPEYLCAYTNSPYGKRLVREKKRGVAQAHLNVGGYSKMSISVPDLRVQRNVVKEIKSRIAQADYILDAINQSLQQAEALRQSILKQAFEENKNV